jgi:hypothetical protein
MHRINIFFLITRVGMHVVKINQNKGEGNTICVPHDKCKRSGRVSEFLLKTYTNDEPEIIKPTHCRSLYKCKHTVIAQRVNCLSAGILCYKCGS